MKEGKAAELESEEAPKRPVQGHPYGQPPALLKYYTQIFGMRNGYPPNA